MTQLADALNLGDSSSFFRVCNSTSLFHAKTGSRTKNHGRVYKHRVNFDVYAESEEYFAKHSEQLGNQ